MFWEVHLFPSQGFWFLILLAANAFFACLFTAASKTLNVLSLYHSQGYL
jgi:hypothetical protein